MKTICLLLSLSLSLVSYTQPKQPDSGQSESAGKLAVQLYTFRNELAQDVPGTLKRIKDLGIDYVEGYDVPFIVGDPDSFKAQLEAAGLKMFALHWNNLEDWRKNPSKILGVAQKFGVHYTGIAWLKTGLMDAVTQEVVNEAADILMETCEEAKEAGLQLYYHIHGYELQPAGNGKTFFDSFIERSNYDCIRLEMDVFWVTYAGFDPVKFIEDHKDGVELFHIKNMAEHVKTGTFTGVDFMPPEMPADLWVPLGQGKIDFKPVFEKGHEIGAKWYILEMDRYEGDPFDAVAASLAYIKKEGLMNE